MEYLNSSTKKAKDFIRRYERATDTTLHDAYKNPSRAKIDAYNNILRDDIERESKAYENPREANIDFYGYKIIGANCSYFTLARLAYITDKDTGEHLNTYLYIDTPTKQYFIWLGKDYIK